MSEFRLIWEPKSAIDPALVSKQVMKYMDGMETFAQFKNDSCLFLKLIPDIEDVISGAMKEAKRLPDFEVFEMEDHDFLVSFANPLKVYVGREEFAMRKEEIQNRFKELHFSSESLMPLSGKIKPDHVLVGLYARGKLQRDAWSDLEYQIVKP